MLFFTITPVGINLFQRQQRDRPVTATKIVLVPVSSSILSYRLGMKSPIQFYQLKQLSSIRLLYSFQRQKVPKQLSKARFFRHQRGLDESVRCHGTTEKNYVRYLILS